MDEINTPILHIYMYILIKNKNNNKLHLYGMFQLSSSNLSLKNYIINLVKFEKSIYFFLQYLF